jgi:hypothetical protein
MLYDEIEIERKKKIIKSKLKKNYGIQSSINLMSKNVIEIEKKKKIDWKKSQTQREKKIIIVYSVLWGKIQ